MLTYQKIMFKRIIKPTLLAVFLMSSFIFTGPSSTQAMDMNNRDSDENSLNIVIDKSNESLDGAKVSKAPDLGDDQAFPFIPGFGKNSGKD